MILEPDPRQHVWLDGRFIPWPQATMHVSDHHYGVGVFEGVRAYGGERGTVIFRLRDHTARLFRSAHILKMQIPEEFGQDELHRVQLELVRRNELSDAYIRPFVFYGGTLGLAPRTQDLTVHVAVLALAWRGQAYGNVESKGVRLRTGTLTRHHPNSVFSKAKANGNYVNGILARQEAQSSGADDVLLLDHGGFVTETSGSNVFIVRNGAVVTPPVCCVLEGITRDTIMVLAGDLGFLVVERQITRDDVYVAEEVFLTGTAVEVAYASEVDGRRIGRGTEGEITRTLRAAYSAHVRGAGASDKDWLSRV